MEITRFCDPFMGENCYLVRDLCGAAAVIDPGFEAAEKVLPYAEEIRAILLTHGHFDHIASVKAIAEQTHAKIYLHEADGAFPQESSLNLSSLMPDLPCPAFSADVLFRDGEQICVGALSFSVLHTPGHTPGSSCFLTDDALFTGDTVLSGSIGRTDFPGGDRYAMRESCRKLAALSGEFRVYPGHGEESAFSYEKRNNLYLRDVSC